MSDIKLFTINDVVTELPSKSTKVEKDLQNLIEKNLEAFLGVRFLKSEYDTGKTHKGRIDTLGLDETNCPVIIEYKRHVNENVINQGLFYLDWLLDHQAEFRWFVMEKLGKEVAEAIEWNGTRLICIASDFNRYDEHAVQQINRNIELMRYKYFGADLLLLELVNAQTATGQIIKDETAKPPKTSNGHQPDKTQEEKLAESPEPLVSLYDQLCDFANTLGDEVQRKELKFYTAFKRIKNFLSVVVTPTKQDPRLQIYLKLEYADIDARYQAIGRDVTNIGHWATGNLELTVRNSDDLELAYELIKVSYEQN
jgi:predicted transport protein